MSGFGPPPGSPSPGSDGPEQTRRRPPSYLPPGGLRHGSAGARTAFGPSRPLLTNAHKPGIIPLRPLSLGDLLDGAAKHVRRNAGPVLALTFLTVTVSVVPAVLVAGLVYSGTWYSALDLGSVVDPGEATALLLFLGVAFAAIALCGMLALPVSEAVLGRRMTTGAMWRGVRPRMWRLVGLAAIVLAVSVAPVVVVVGLLVLLADAPGVVVTLAGIVALVVVAAWVMLVVWRTALAGPAIVLEGRGVRDALRRAWALSGRSFWRIAGSVALTAAIGGLVFSVLGLVIGLIGLALAAGFAYGDDGFDALAILSSNIATIIGASVVTPLVAGAVALLYVDLRMRKEGFDVVLQRAAAGLGSTAGSRR